MSGELLFVPGQMGGNDDGSPKPVFEDQMRWAFANLRSVLAAADLGLDDATDVATVHADPDRQLENVMEARDTKIGAAPYLGWPPIGVNWLAGFDCAAKVIARIPESQKPA